MLALKLRPKKKKKNHTKLNTNLRNFVNQIEGFKSCRTYVLYKYVNEKQPKNKSNDTNKNYPYFIQISTYVWVIIIL